MPIQLKRCFQYLSLFPKGTSLDSEEIVRLWMSQGLLPLDGDRRADDIGKKCIKSLTERSLIHLSYIHYSMHDLVHDLAQYVAQDECLCVMDDNFNTEKLQMIRHLSVTTDRHKFSIEDLQLQKLLQAIKDLQQLKRLRTLFIRNYCDKRQIRSSPVPQSTRPRTNTEEVNYERLRVSSIISKFCEEMAVHSRHVIIFGVLEDLFEKLKYIRALYLNYIGITQLPDSLGNLKLLRYLSIEDTNIQSLPESICCLYNLQILNSNIFKLPTHIGNLINLCHLSLTRQDTFLPSGIGNLTNLQTLNHFNVSHEKEHCDIGELNSLMKLGGTIDICHVGYVNIFSNSPPLKTKKYVNSLRLDWCKKDYYLSKQDEKKAEQQLAYLQPHVNLKSLEIYNYPGVKFVEWVSDSSFTKLTKLSLVKCKNCTKLPSLGQLPSLEYLMIRRMDDIQHVGREFCSMLMASPSNSFQNNIAFPSLKSLMFWEMFNWEVWDGVEIGDFPSLQYIQIYSFKLIKFPQFPFMSSVERMGLGSVGVPVVSNFQSLTNLDINIITQEHSEWMSKCYFPTLQHLTLLYIMVECVHLSQKQLPSLKTLKMKYSGELKFIKGLKNFTSLNSLIIKECPILEFDKVPATLQQLKFKNCPLFEKGFKEQQGHMPNILMIEERDPNEEEEEKRWWIMMRKRRRMSMMTREMRRRWMSDDEAH
ncbi:putative disease resistance protein At3g14460 [Zingiber officinale]|uniref:putative disease resistance protein At3g14460 n=1 Tax=Zingiber officinale TaxID=94328 RepID=UPI001C4B4D45|nr:putative disease resistance protein At3g14460 [Zingiber officinale]